MIYLDNAATSFPKPQVVYDTLAGFACTRLANPGRAGHRMATDCERAVDEARFALNRLFNGESPLRWIFTLNGTDALNMAIKGVLRQGHHVVTSDLEHNSVSRPLRALELAGFITVTRVASEDGYLDPAEVRAAIRPNTALVVLTHASNVLGTVQPIEEIARSARAAGALFLVDAAQSAGVVPIDLRATPIDLLAFPGHKALYGPTGTGALYVGPRAQCIRAWREGGTGGDSARETQPAELPYFLEGGTPNVLGIAGLAAGIAWINERGMEVNRRHEVELLQQVVDWTERAYGWRMAGEWDPATHVGALSLIVPEGISPQDLGGILDSTFDIAVRPGLHCAALYPQEARHVSRGNLAPQPGTVQHERRPRAFPGRADPHDRGDSLRALSLDVPAVSLNKGKGTGINVQGPEDVPGDEGSVASASPLGMGSTDAALDGRRGAGGLAGAAPGGVGHLVTCAAAPRVAGRSEHRPDRGAGRFEWDRAGTGGGNRKSTASQAVSLARRPLAPGARDRAGHAGEPAAQLAVSCRTRPGGFPSPGPVMESEPFSRTHQNDAGFSTGQPVRAGRRSAAGDRGSGARA